MPHDVNGRVRIASRKIMVRMGFIDELFCSVKVGQVFNFLYLNREIHNSTEMKI